MGKRDLKFLKKSLKEIYKKNAEIAKLQEKKKINSKELAKSKKLIEKLESDNQFQQLDLDDLTQLWGDSIPDSLTVNQLKDILHGYGLPVSGNKKELKKRIIRYSRTSRAEKTISSGTLVELRENVKKVTKKVQLDEKRRELNRHPV